jgi:hypothetical protein
VGFAVRECLNRIRFRVDVTEIQETRMAEAQFVTQIRRAEELDLPLN